MRRTAGKAATGRGMGLSKEEQKIQYKFLFFVSVHKYFYCPPLSHMQAQT
jgi:hypothetical protein